MRFARDGTAPSSCGTTSPLRMLRKGPLCFLSFSSSAHCWQQEWCLLQVCGLPFLCLCSLSPPLFFFNCIEDFKIRIVSCSYPIHCQCLLLPLYPALLLIPWSLAPLLLPLFTQKLCTSQSAMLYRLGKKKKDCLPCLEVLYREVLDFGTTHELPSSCISPFRGQLRTASKNVQHCRHCFVRDARSKMHMPNLSLIEP